MSITTTEIFKTVMARIPGLTGQIKNIKNPELRTMNSEL